MTRPILRSLPDGRILGKGTDFLVSDGGGLTINYNGGTFVSECLGNFPPSNMANFSVNAGSLAMEDNATNYVCIQLDDYDLFLASVVTNLVSCPNEFSLATVVTSGGKIVSITDNRACLFSPCCTRIMWNTVSVQRAYCGFSPALNPSCPTTPACNPFLSYPHYLTFGVCCCDPDGFSNPHICSDTIDFPSTCADSSPCCEGDNVRCGDCGSDEVCSNPLNLGSHALANFESGVVSLLPSFSGVFCDGICANCSNGSIFYLNATFGESSPILTVQLAHYKFTFPPATAPFTIHWQEIWSMGALNFGGAGCSDCSSELALNPIEHILSESISIGQSESTVHLLDYAPATSFYNPTSGCYGGYGGVEITGYTRP